MLHPFTPTSVCPLEKWQDWTNNEFLMLQIHWFQHAMTINKIELSDKPFLGNGAGGGGEPSTPPPHTSPPTDGFLSLHPAWLTPSRAICTLCFPGLRKKIPLSHWINITPLAENLLLGAAPSLCQYFQNVQVSKQDLTGWRFFFFLRIKWITLNTVWRLKLD